MSFDQRYPELSPNSQIGTRQQYASNSLSVQLTEPEWECLADISVSNVWEWLVEYEERGVVMFFGGRGGTQRWELGTW